MAIALSGSLVLTGSLTTSGNIVAQTLVVSTISSSVEYSSGSNIFGNTLTNQQIFTGSLQVTGSNHGIFGTVGFGIIPSQTWNYYYKAIQIGAGGSIYALTPTGARLNLGNNHYNNLSNQDIFAQSDVAAKYQMDGTSHAFLYANAGTAGNPITFTTAMTITGSNVGIGTTTPSGSLHLYGTAPYVYITTTNGARTWLAGADSNGYVIYDNTAGAYRMILSAAGNFGIGAATPADIIDVRKNQNATTNFYFRNTDTTDVNSRAYLNVIAGNTTLSLLALHGGDTYIAGTSGRNMYFQQNPGGTVNMFISASGNVGIGTTNPDETLTIASGNAISIRTAGSGTYGALKFGTNVSAYYASWAGIDSNNEGVGVNVSNLRFYTSYGSIAERMRIAASGNFYVYSMAASAGTNAVKFNTSTGQVTYDTSSARYKNNIRDSIYGLNNVMQLKSKMFEYKEDNRTDIGLIAEEVYEVIPELVGLNKDGMPNSVSYDRFISVLVKAIQELKAQNDNLQAILQRNNIN